LIKWVLVTILAAAGTFLVGADTHDLTMFIVSKLIGVLLIGIAWFASLVEAEDK
jgi:cell shape-determining protein MreD